MILSGQGYRTPTQVISAPVVIEDDAWIGFKAIILKGVSVGRGAIVASGAVVTKDVEPWTVVAGNPAQVIKILEPTAVAR
jgi:acetyltransferase-like isoleucine patch superfamily enzyme